MNTVYYLFSIMLNQFNLNFLYIKSEVVIVQLPGRVQLFVTPWTAVHQASLSFTISWSLCKLMFTWVGWNQWCHPTISSSATPFSFCLQSFPGSGSFPMSQLLTSSGQSIGASASASVLLMNIRGWFPLGLVGLISAVQGTLKSLLQHHNLKASILWCSAFFMVQISHSYMTTPGRLVFNWIMWLVFLSSPGPSPCLSTLLPVRCVQPLFPVLWLFHY